MISFKEVADSVAHETMETPDVDDKKASKAHDKLAKVKEQIHEIVKLFGEAGMSDPHEFVASQIRASGMPRAKEEGMPGKKKESKNKALIIATLKRKKK